MRKRPYVGALRVYDGCLMLSTLRHAEEVVTAAELSPPKGREIRQNERHMAEQLVSMYEGEFDPSEYTNAYRERVLALVETKARGGKLALRKVAPKAPGASLSDALKASINEARRRKKVA
jgi:DNA end-binding protein Ku